jgi:phosphoglycerol transferase MdoB-like AlkP superfamily enzyme
LWVVLATLFFGAVTELVFWNEFSTRFIFIAVDYLIYTHEVIGNIQQSYPTGWIFAGIGGLALAVIFVLSRFVRLTGAPMSLRKRFALLALAVVLPSASWTLSSVDQMGGIGNTYADELSGNGLFTLAAAMRRNELDYDKFYETIPQARADAVLKSLGVERIPLSSVVDVKEDPFEPEEMGPFTRRPKNVVLISVESLSAEFLGVYGNKKGLTPNLDRLAKEGYKFDRVFATGTRTVRGLDALSLGAPPMPGQAIVRRPGNEHLATIGEFLQHRGFATFFIYGGYGYFDNMNAYFNANNYKVVDRTDFPKESIVQENIWGVADEVLFANSLKVLDTAGQGGKPFFAHIMTTSNHRPYTYPDGRIDIPSPGGRDGAVKYTDFAIGQFIEQAKTKPWFADTLFVIVADHCASAAGKTSLPMANYHIPMIFYAPAMLPAGSYSRLVSQIDLVPTLLDLLGIEGDDYFFGESLFEASTAPERAFISNYQELGYYKDGILTVLAPRRAVSAFRVEPGTYAATPTKVVPALREEAIAFYQTASRAFKQGALASPNYSNVARRRADVR